jgi:ABC-type multidrug transport system ATPase subunit
MSGGGSPGAAADFDAVHLSDVSRHYGRRRALARVTFSAHAGAIVGLFGPNGSGKSTLLGVLSTLIRPTTGAVLYGKQTALELGDELRGRIGVLGHDLFLYGDLTARENLEFFARLYKVGDVDACVDGALDAARLQDRADDRVSGFSRGMRQRLALERALVHEPRLLLLDEPFTGLDDQAASLLHGRLRSVRERGTIVLMSTHDFEIADGLVDRALCLDQGRLREFGTSAGGSLRERYRAMLQEPWT